MKSKNLLIIITIILLLMIAIVVGVIMLTKGNAPQKDPSSSSGIMSENEIFVIPESTDVLLCETKADLDKYAKDNEYEVHYEDIFGWLAGIELFDCLADVEVTLDSDKISMINSYFYIYEVPYTEETPVDADEDVEFEYVPHIFTEEEKQDSIEAMEIFKTYFEEFLGCGIFTYYDVVSTGFVDDGVDESLLSEEERFYKGYVLREYSVKDKDGVLWLLRFSASDYDVSATIVKIVDQTNFEGFIPIIDMNKEDSAEIDILQTEDITGE